MTPSFLPSARIPALAAALVTLATTAVRPAVVDLQASAYGQVSIAAALDPLGHALPGPVSDYVSQSETGSELAQIALVSVTDRDGNDALSSATLSASYGNGYASLGFFDPTLFYDGAAYGGIVLISSFINISGQSLIADVVVGVDLMALAASASPFGKGQARADVIAEGVVQRPGAFKASATSGVSAAVSGIGQQSDARSQGWHYAAFLQPGDRMVWTISLDSRVSGTLAPVPVPAAAVLFGAGLAALVGLRRRRRA